MNKDFVRNTHKTLDNFVKKYKTAPKDKQLLIDRRCYKFIETITVYEVYQLGFKSYYEKRKQRGGE